MIKFINWILCISNHSYKNFKVKKPKSAIVPIVCSRWEVAGSKKPINDVIGMQLHSYLRVHVIQAQSTLCTMFLPVKKVTVCFLVF